VGEIAAAAAARAFFAAFLRDQNGAWRLLKILRVVGKVEKEETGRSVQNRFSDGLSLANFQRAHTH
jgi:hypothetical protein